ncbi:hypothetical protein Trydic_g7153 [Trypoxylus dichotomus]
MLQEDTTLTSRMAWQPWSSNTPGVVPTLPGLTSVVNPAPAVLPAGSQYTPEQWAQMQQQNWQQWAQWQQQYQQWHQQYGAEYQKSMSALSQVSQGNSTFQPPVPNTSVPPPLPKESKPPLPPEEPPKENLGNASNKNFNPQPNFMSTPPPNFNPAPQSRNQPPPNARSGSGTFKNNYNNRSMSQNPFNDATRNTPSRQDYSGEKRPISQPNLKDPKKTKLDETASQRSTPTNPNDDMSETEKRFVKQFTEWESQFNKWKEQNMNHPDKEQYKEYEKKWETWRTQLLERREQMRRRRLGLSDSKPGQKPIAMPQVSLNVSLPPPLLNKDVDTTKPPPLIPQDISAIIKESEAMKDSFTATSTSSLKEIPDDECPNEKPEDRESDDFLKMSKTSDGIPGLDLVKDGRDDEEKREDVINLEEEGNKIKDLGNDHEEQKGLDAFKGPDFEAISKGINNILGDQKLLNMLSLVSQNQNQTYSGTIDTTSRIPTNTDFQNNFRNSNENSTQGVDRWSNPPDQQDYFNRGNDNVSNYDDQSRSSFGGKTGDFDWRDRQRGANQSDINTGIDDYDQNYDNDQFENPEGYDRQGTFRDSDNFRDPNNFRGPDHFRGGPDDYKGESDNFRGRPDSYRGGPDNFRGGSDNFRGGPDNVRGGLDNFRGGPHNYRGGPAFRGGPDNFRGGSDFRGGPDNFRGGPDNFRGGPDNFIGGPQNFRGAGDNFRSGPENLGDRPPNLRGGSDFRSRVDGFRDDKGSDTLHDSDNFGGRSDNFKDAGNFRGVHEGPINTFEPPPNNNFRERFEPPNRNSSKFNRNDDFNRFEDDHRRTGDFGRRQDREFGNRDFRSDDNARRNFPDQDNFRPNERTFDRPPPSRNSSSFKPAANQQGPNNFRGAPDFQPPSANFGRGPNDFSRSPGFQDDQGNFGPNMEESNDYRESPAGIGDWSGQHRNDFDKNQGFADNIPHRQGFDTFIPPEAIQNNEILGRDPASIAESITDNNAEEKEEKLWQPTNIIEYDHKSSRTDDLEVSFEPLRSFDYRHKPVNRIPFPHRPPWLATMLKKYTEFDFVLPRTYDQPFSRYSERFDRYSETPRYDYRWNNPPGTNRRIQDEPNRHPAKRYDDYGPNISRRPEGSSNYPPKKDHDRPIEDVDMRDDGREGKHENYKNKHENYKNKSHMDASPIDLEDPPESEKFAPIHGKSQANSNVCNVTLIQDMLNPPGRYNRPPRIVIILRGPPGSGKTFLAKLIKDKEVENGGSAPRILSLDDYFMVEQEKEVEVDGKKTQVKEMVYEYEQCMENTYRVSLFKAFKKTITDGYFPFIIVDNVNDKVKYFGEMWSFAKQNGFQVYICQMEFDLATCTKRNIHNRSESEIQKLITGWEPTPNHHPILDATSLIQAGSIPEVEMEEINSPPSDDFEMQTVEDRACRSKWDNFDCSIDNLAKLDGTNKPLRASKTMEDYLQCDDDWVSRESKPGQKRVRWADLEERKTQEKMRAIGFVVGQTNWDRMMDPTMGSSALTQTKYIERTNTSRFY